MALIYHKETYLNRFVFNKKDFEVTTFIESDFNSGEHEYSFTFDKGKFTDEEIDAINEFLEDRDFDLDSDEKIVILPQNMLELIDTIKDSSLSEKEKLRKTKEIVEQGADIHADDDRVLGWAAYYGHLEVVKYLVEQGADIHADNDFALRWAANKGQLEVVKYLVEQGADIHAKDDQALGWAVNEGHLEIVKYLVENGADIHANNDCALIWAAENGYLEIVKYLVEKGANIHADNDQALKSAINLEDTKVADYLKEVMQQENQIAIPKAEEGIKNSKKMKL